jgi:citrate lyase beta subunit
MRRVRTLLFLPGTRLDRFDRALASGADTICIDLEDAVGPNDKLEARRAVAARFIGLRRSRPWSFASPRCRRLHWLRSNRPCATPAR